MRRARRNSLLALIGLLTVAAQPARPTKEDIARQQMEQAEKARAAEQAAQQAATTRAVAAAAEAQRLAADRIAAAAKLRAAEAATADAADQVDRLASRQRQARASLDARAETMQPLLPVIERLSLFPAETLLAIPGQPEDTLRGVLVLRGLARQLGEDAVALRQEQARLLDTTAAVQAEVPKLAAAQAQQQQQAAALERQFASAQASQHAAEGEAIEAARRAADNAAQADTLRGMLATLDQERRTAAAQAREDATRAERQKQADQAAAARARQTELERPAGAGTIATTAQPRGQLTAPVAGKIVRSWGDATAGGPASGISYQAPPEARVVSICSGHVVFAAPFRSYGLLLIVDCGGGYHAVLAGFDKLDVKVGQNVAAGEPVGVMPNWQPGATGERPTLYVELRRDSQPVNPAPWLKASG
jgi:septal ring factor EnvC (AmiA/AmiB activator)